MATKNKGKSTKDLRRFVSLFFVANPIAKCFKFDFENAFMTPFTKIIDGFQTLSIEEMEEMPIIVNNILVQRKREAIKMNAEDSRKRYEQGVLKSFTEPKALINWLLDDDDKT